MPPPTAASNRAAACASRRRGRRVTAPCFASVSLFAETTGFPARRARAISDRARVLRPPSTSTTILHGGMILPPRHRRYSTRPGARSRRGRPAPAPVPAPQTRRTSSPQLRRKQFRARTPRATALLRSPHRPQPQKPHTNWCHRCHARHPPPHSPAPPSCRHADSTGHPAAPQDTTRGRFRIDHRSMREPQSAQRTR